ncbi:membrane protein insertase YidC [Caldisericum exile]|uniref:membrane protein insertase YidC n=1 Tax=Caldisericum exile TaxID=693075 RepID=UPI003C788EF7
MKKILFVFGFVLLLSVFLTGCATSPFPKTTEPGVIVQVVATGRPLENIPVGLRVVNNTPDPILDVTVKLISINGNEDLKPFELWKSTRELSIKDVSKTSVIDAGKDATFTFYITSYTEIEPKPYPIKFAVTYKDANGKITTIDKEAVINVVPVGGLYKAMRFIIEAINKVTKNYGLAIIVLTILIKLITHPLTRYQFKSTAKLQEIQPELKKIQEKYKDNPQKQQQEIVKLYKEKGVNMYGGCLPVLIQWPLLIILYGALMNYAPFNNARFLWLSNLNVPDKYYILPALVFLSMFLQSKTSQLPGTEMDPNTKMFMYFLPIIFAVWAVSWPPSVLLYWITFSLVATFEQYLIIRSIEYFKKMASEEPKEVIKKEKKEK